MTEDKLRIRCALGTETWQLEANRVIYWLMGTIPAPTGPNVRF